MPILILLALLNITALWGMVAGRPTGIRWIAALASLALPVYGQIVLAELAYRNRVRTSLAFGPAYIICAYGALILLCLTLIIKAGREDRSSHFYLGLFTLIVTLLLCWLVYELTHSSWKYGG